MTRNLAVSHTTRDDASSKAIKMGSAWVDRGFSVLLFGYDPQVSLYGLAAATHEDTPFWSSRTRQATTVQQIVLAAPSGDFRVQVTASQFQLNAVPLRRSRNGEWVPEEHAQGPLARWQLQPNGAFVRIG